MAEVGCLNDGHFQNLNVDGISYLPKLTLQQNTIDLDQTTYALSVAESGSTCIFDGTACTVTLPDAAAGLEYTFLVDATAGVNSIITTQSSDKLTGGFIKSTAAFNNTNLSDTTSAIDMATGTSNTLTMNGTSQGGVLGSTIRVIGIKANLWSVSGVVIGSGNLATSFT
tara:strand:- start:67 stop:573 length:507 start_codon:yes stop_codon:yes gene_type:complete